MSSSSSDGDTSSTEEAEDYGKRRSLDACTFAPLRPTTLRVPPEFCTWRHRVSGVQHLQFPEALKFQCGRRVTDRYVLTDGDPLVEVSVCQACIRSKTVVDANES